MKTTLTLVAMSKGNRMPKKNKELKSGQEQQQQKSVN